MKTKILIAFFIVGLLFHPTISFAQITKKFMADFLIGDELSTENVIANYVRFNFSDIWTQTPNYQIVGIIGADYQRIKIKLTSVKKSSTANSNVYLVTGKSMVKGIVCDFHGSIKLTNIKKVKKLHFGVDDEYKNSGIKSEGILIAEYEFKGNEIQKHSGIFKGQLYSKWYLNANNQIKLDNILSFADSYMNNAFIGIWKEYSTNKEKICNWADYRVPNINRGFDIGEGNFSPSEKYYDKGWRIYQKAWLNGDKEAKKEEYKEWWK